MEVETNGLERRLRGRVEELGLCLLRPDPENCRRIADDDPYITEELAPSIREAGLLSGPIAITNTHSVGVVRDAIVAAAQQVADGELDEHFPVDVFQTGSGTSTNMNANEVIANRALELLGHDRGDYRHCHPNNHVNLSQSTNDAYPTAVRVAVILELADLLAAHIERWCRDAGVPRP